MVEKSFLGGTGVLLRWVEITPCGVGVGEGGGGGGGGGGEGEGI